MKKIQAINYRLPILLALITIIFPGCTHYYYAPNMHNVPVFQQKGETRINLAVSTGDEFTAFELQGAYAATDHLGAVLNFMTGGNTNEDTKESGHGTYVEGGAGYYMTLGGHGVFEAYGDLGFGGISNEYSINSVSDVSFMKLSVQPAIALRTSALEIALSLRMSNLNYMSISEEFNRPTREHEQLAYIDDHSSSLLAEPAFTLRLGWKYLKLQTQIGVSYNLTAHNLQQEISNINIGLIISIPQQNKSSTQ